MVKLSEKAVEDFARRYQNHFGIELKLSEAEIKATEFLKFFSIISKPMLSKGENEAVQDQDNK
jgi:hypothetical protein